MNVKEFAQSESFYHPHADAWLVRGRAKGLHVIGWISRQRTESITHIRKFIDDATAAREFLNIIRKDDVPEKISQARDWQKNRVYRWEDKHVLPSGEILDNPVKARRLLRRIADEYGIQCPRLRWMPHTGYSEYDADENFIAYGDRNSMTLLHEMAHAIHAQQLGDPISQHHSPGFVDIAIELYHRYGGLDQAILTHTAGKAGLLGDLYQPEKRPKPKQRPAEYIFR